MIYLTHKTVNGDFTDNNKVWNSFVSHVQKLKHVNVLSSQKHDFYPQGMTGLILLSESHAAIHTWPELNKAWIELATCGDQEDLELFKNWVV